MSSSSRGCPFIRNEFRTAAATTTHPREVHPGAEPTHVATHDRRRRIRRLGSTRLSSEMVYFVFNGKTINGQTKTMANARSHRHRRFFSPGERPSYYYYLPTKHIFFVRPLRSHYKILVERIINYNDGVHRMVI